MLEAMTVLKAQVTIPRITGVPADAVVNTFHFDTDADDVEAAGYFVTIRDRLRILYQTLDNYLSALVASPAVLKVYNLKDPQPRAPIGEDTIPLAGMQAADFPAEIAVCASYAAAAASGESMRRRRGRIYIGPTNSTTRGAIENGDPIVLPSARTAIGAALQVLASANDPKWCVWSAAAAGAPAGVGGAYTQAQLDAGANDVTNGWVDDRFDIQRRRGAKPTTRTTWAV